MIDINLSGGSFFWLVVAAIVLAVCVATAIGLLAYQTLLQRPSSRDEDAAAAKSFAFGLVCFCISFFGWLVLLLWMFNPPRPTDPPAPAEDVVCTDNQADC